MSGKKTDKLPDAELCSRLSGDKEQAEAAFAELYARYSGRIYAYCLRFLGNCDDANDVFQETFIRFFRSAPKVKHMGSVLGYLLKTARYVCINQRRDRKHADAFEDYQVQVPPQTNEDAEFMKLITTALEMLPDDYRDPLILREYEGLSYAEIAETIGASLSNVKIRIFRAKQMIRDILAPYLQELEND